MNRRAGLRRDSEKTRAWLVKPRKQLARRSRLKPGKRKRRQPIPPEVRALVLARSGGNCVACLIREGIDQHSPLWTHGPHPSRWPVRRAFHLHHFLPVQTWPELELDPDNMGGVCPECHDEHERAHRRIPRAALGLALALAVRVGAPAEAYVEKTYPA